MADTFTLDDVLAEVERLAAPTVAVVLPYGTDGAILARWRAELGPGVMVRESPVRDQPPVGSCFVLDLTVLAIGDVPLEYPPRYHPPALDPDAILKVTGV